MREQIELYRKWFKTFLRREFLNLPSEYQRKFLDLLNSFKRDCERCYEEHKSIKEKIIKVTITKLGIIQKGEYYWVYGKTEDNEEEFKISYPKTLKLPEIGESMDFVTYSLDEQTWYSSKEELLIGRIKKC